jgi:hypothetical protein
MEEYDLFSVSSSLIRHRERHRKKGIEMEIH